MLTISPINEKRIFRILENLTMIPGLANICILHSFGSILYGISWGRCMKWLYPGAGTWNGHSKSQGPWIWIGQTSLTVLPKRPVYSTWCDSRYCDEMLTIPQLSEKKSFGFLSYTVPSLHTKKDAPMCNDDQQSGKHKKKSMALFNNAVISKV